MSYKSKIVSTGKYLPEGVITNFDLEKLVDTNDEWIVSRTGINTRRKALESVLDMAYNASMDAIKKAEYDKDKIDLIIVATITNEIKSPSIANLLQEKLGLNDKQVMAFDVNAACTGFVYALEVATSLLQSGKFKSALIVGSEKMTNIVDFTDRNTCILFGDGAGSMIVEPGDRDLFFYNDSKGDSTKILEVDKYVKMNGPRVYQFAVDIIPKTINKILRDNNLTLDDIDVIIPHQANKRIVESIIKEMNLSDDKVILNIDRYGNTSAASIPITIAEYKEENKDLKTILIVGFGGGFTWGAAILKI
ncbi:beta-ketoacyl-ACP synthase III [Haploplasma modicum]|uniref:beta-ketoacyl-ACP synthase III n=1 Tax=Haploplasma modicum TaxID=2150 RepID=UPI00214C6AA2|nr:beta-ketoacyl-ACP synthase III [Haploplasma modicum]MCR1809165.1 ketoacyl-ACP synthase III [Haploplasma modicum]